MLLKELAALVGDIEHALAPGGTTALLGSASVTVQQNCGYLLQDAGTDGAAVVDVDDAVAAQLLGAYSGQAAYGDARDDADDDDDLAELASDSMGEWWDLRSRHFPDDAHVGLRARFEAAYRQRVAELCAAETVEAGADAESVEASADDDAE